MGDNLQTIASASVNGKGDKSPSPSVSGFGDIVQINQAPNRVIRQCGIQLNAPPNFQSIVRHPILAIRVPYSIIIISNDWPCWLVPLLALTLTLAGAYFSKPSSSYFLSPTDVQCSEINDQMVFNAGIDETQSLPSCPLIILASGTEALLS